MNPSAMAPARNTPTCVGKTSCCCGSSACVWKHPHVRGEDPSAYSTESFYGETPPRAWGRPCSRWHAPRKSRNTPTCVGKTPRWRTARSSAWKHPHVRGEDSITDGASPSASETPPRAWGRPHAALQNLAAPGNTPTCVGKTFSFRGVDVLRKKHPHVRGEDDKPYSQLGWRVETPPRAWGRL